MVRPAQFLPRQQRPQLHTAQCPNQSGGTADQKLFSLLKRLNQRCHKYLCVQAVGTVDHQLAEAGQGRQCLNDTPVV